MGLKVNHLPSLVASRLRAFYRRKRLLGLLRAAFASGIAYGLLALVAMHADRLLFLAVSTRVGMFWIVHVLWAAVTLAMLLPWLLRRPSVRQIAYELESRVASDPAERYVTLDDVLARGVGQDSPVSRDLLAQLAGSAVEHARGVRAGRLVRDRKVWWLLVVLALVAATHAALLLPTGYQYRLMVERFLFPERNLPKPSFVQIEVRPARILAGRGEEAVIEAEISGSIPRPLRWLMERLGMTTSRCIIAIEDGLDGPVRFDRAEKVDMSRVQRNLFLYAQASLTDSFRYRIRCGDAETEIRFARVVAQPEVREVSLAVTPPAYTGLDEETITDTSRTLRLLPGSRVRLTFRTDQPVDECAVVFAKRPEPVEPDWDEATRTGRHEFVVKSKTVLEIQVARIVEGRRFANVARKRVTIDLLADRAPTVRLEYPPGDLQKVPAEIIPVRATVEDDLGLTELALVYVVNPDQADGAVRGEIPLELSGTRPRSVNVAAMFPLDKTGAIPGDVVLLQLRARDSEGKDGVGREVFIHVVAFTRGENERKRLVALATLAGALAELAGDPKPAAVAAPSDAMAVGKAAFEKIAARADRQGVVLGEEPSVRALLEMLEREMHFTDAPSDKADARKLYGVLRAAAAPLDAEVLRTPYAARAAVAAELAGKILPGLVHYRQLKNLIWRLFGMRYEAASIRETLGKLADSKRSDANLVISAKKRAALYSRTLQDIGAELIDLSRSSPALDEQKALDRVGQMNVVGNWLKRGSLSARQARCIEVRERIVAVIELARAALPALFEAAQVARAALDARWARCLARIGQPPAGAEARAWAAHATDWLDDDARLLKWCPFVPFWPRLANLALWEAVVAVGREGAGSAEAAHLREVARAVLSPSPSVVAAIGRQRSAAAALAFDWQVDAVRSLAKVSQTEKAFEIGLLEAEELALRRALGPQELRKRFGAIERLDLRTGAARVPATRTSRDSKAVAALRETADLLAVEGGRLLPSVTPAETFGKLLPGLAATDRTLAAAGTLAGGKGQDASARVAAAVRAVMAEMAQLRRALARAALHVAYRSSGDGAEADELLLLKVRNAHHRYVSRSTRVLASAREMLDKPLDPATLAELSTNLDILKYSHERTLRGGIEKALAGRAGGGGVSDADRRRYTILPEFARTRRAASIARALASGAGGADLARAFMVEFKQAALAFLAGRARLLDRAGDALAEAEALLKRRTPDAKAFDAKLEAALTQLRAMRAAVAQTGGGELQASLTSGMAGLVRRIERLRLGDAGVDPTRVSARRFDLEQIRRALAGLGRDARGAAGQLDQTVAGFRGGPAGIWARQLQYDAETTHRRLVGQYVLARRRVTEGVLEALARKPDPRRYDDASAWADHLHRLVRSDLYGLGSHRIGRRRKDVDQPLVKWLRDQRDKAALVRGLTHYPKPTAEYLESMKSELRR